MSDLPPAPKPWGFWDRVGAFVIGGVTIPALLLAVVGFVASSERYLVPEAIVYSGSPAPAGIDPSSSTAGGSARRLPRTRGDRPPSSLGTLGADLHYPLPVPPSVGEA